MATVNTSFLTWKDPYAWTEDMREFKRVAAQENEAFDAALKGIKDQRQRLAAEFAAAAEDHAKDILWTHGSTVEYRPNFEGGGGYFWRFCGSKAWKDAGSLDVATIGGATCVVYTVESGKGTQSYTLLARRQRGGHAWKSDVEISSDIAVMDSFIYALEVDTPLRYNRLIAINLETGKKHSVLFENTDSRWTLRLVRGSAGGLFLLREQAGYSYCYHIRTGGLDRIAPNAACIYPIGLGPNGGPQWLERTRSFSSPWVLHGDSPWRFKTDDGIEFASASGIFITRNFGERQLWRAGDEQPVQKVWGTVLVDPLANWRGSGISSIWVIGPGSTPQCFSLNGTRMVKGNSYAKVNIGIAISKDGLPVRWLLAHRRSERRLKGLVVIAYGGYGAPTPLSTARWKPWIDAGWGIGFALVRGGGDGTDVWASLGRLSGKENGIDDLEAVLVTLQELTGIQAAKTIVYGRSAGGLLVGGIAGRHPNGGLARTLYAEVPYVDLLKTASNPNLPLTPSEYEEFGNPIAGPAEFEQALRSSPVHRLPTDGALGLRVVCRTGMFDLQVYPYESLKWILALRGPRPAPDGKFLKVEMEGHFTQGDARYNQLAEDFLLLDC